MFEAGLTHIDMNRDQASLIIRAYKPFSKTFFNLVTEISSKDNVILYKNRP